MADFVCSCRRGMHGIVLWLYLPFCSDVLVMFSLMASLCDIVTLQRIPLEEYYGSDFTYKVVRRPVSTDSWTMVTTLPSNKSSFSYMLGSMPVELAIVSKNEIGESLPSTVFTISSAALCQFSVLLVCI